MKIQLDPDIIQSDSESDILDHIFTELKKNTHEVIVVDFYQDRFEQDLGGLGKFINYMLNISGYQILSWWIWSFIAYIGSIYFYKTFLKRNNRYKRYKLKKS